MAYPSHLEPIASAVRSVADRDPQIAAVYVFGSRAEGTATEDSDLDLAVLFNPPAAVDEIVRAQHGLSESVGLEVDLVDLGTCGAFLALAAIKGERLYCRNEAACDEFDLYVLRRAGDLAYFEQERRRMLLGLGDPPTAE